VLWLFIFAPGVSNAAHVRLPNCRELRLKKFKYMNSALMKRLFASLICGVLVFGLLGTVAQAATPFLTLDSFSGKPGTQVRVNGGNFLPDETVNIFLGSLSSPAAGSDVVRGDSLWGPVTVTIPLNATPGSLVITGKGASSSALASNTFFVTPLTPAITISSSANTPGSQISVSGTGFGPNENVIITFDTATSTFSADSAGNFSGTVTIPSVTSDTYLIHATGESSGADATAYFFVGGFYPTILASSFYALPGDMVSWSGSGFAPNETVTISNATTTYATITANGSGSFTNAGSFAIPFGIAQTITFTATSSVSKVTIPVTISLATFIPQLTPSTFFLQRTNSFTVSGTGFAPNESVTVKVRGNDLQTLTADGSGNFASGPFVVPLSSPSTITATATGLSSGATAATSLSVGDIVSRVTEPATLVIDFRVDNSHGGTATLEDFSAVINGANADPGTLTFAASTTTTSTIAMSTATTTIDGDTDFTITFVPTNTSYSPQWQGRCDGQVIAGDTGTCTLTALYTPATSITPATLSSVTVGSSFEQNLNVETDSTGPFTWSISSGSLPDGLTLDTASTEKTTTIKGSLVKLGTFTFTVNVTNGVVSANRTYSMQVGLSSPAAPSGSGGGGGGGGGGSGSIGGGAGVVVLNTAPSTPGIPNTANTNTPSTSAFAQNLRMGSRGDAVRALQIRLRTEGFFTFNVTGIFGPITQKALQAYQSAHGLPATGFFGPLTRSAMNNAALALPTPLPPNTASVSTGNAPTQASPDQAAVSQLASVLNQLVSLLNLFK